MDYLASIADVLGFDFSLDLGSMLSSECVIRNNRARSVSVFTFGSGNGPEANSFSWNF
jgi:hypothetical protein